MVDARKERIDAGKAWDLIHNVKNITTAKGKKVQRWEPGVDDKTTILKHVMGPSGNLRAPAYRIADEFVIGFNPEFYDKWMAGK